MGLRLLPIIRLLSACCLLAVLAASPALAQQSDGSGEAAMVERVNAMRSEAGLSALERDARLDSAARTHSADMAWHQMLEHVSPRTGTPADRVGATGVTAARLVENVAFNSSTANAQAALEASDAHRANMLTDELTHIGVSVVFADGGVFVTQVFATIEDDVASSTTAPPSLPSLPSPAPAPPPPDVAALSAPSAPASPVAPAPLALVGGVEAAPIPPASVAPVVDAVPTQAGARRVTGYWVQWQGQWFYYPLPPGAQPGQRLAPDLSVRGGPGSAGVRSAVAVHAPVAAQQTTTYVQQQPGYVVAQPGYVGQPGYRVYATPRPTYRVQLGMPAPWAVQPQRMIVRPTPRIRFRTRGHGRRLRRF